MFTFKPGPPKPAESLTVSALKTEIANGNQVTSAKSVGDGVMKVFMTGEKNFYVKDSRQLRTLLNKCGLEV